MRVEKIFRAYRCNELPIRKDDSPIKMRLRRMKLRVSPTADEVWEDRLEHFMCNPPPLIDERDNPPAFTSRPAPSLPVSFSLLLFGTSIKNLYNFRKQHVFVDWIPNM